jgi:hypothetical protein
MHQIDSAVEETKTRGVAYASCKPESWGQPSIDRYVFAVRGTRMYGQLIGGAYVSSGSTGVYAASSQLTENLLTSGENLTDLQTLLEAGMGLGSEAYLTMLASEDVLRRDWDDSEEDAIWADL